MDLSTNYLNSHVRIVLLIALVVSTLSVNADQQWESLGYNKGQGAI